MSNAEHLANVMVDAFIAAVERGVDLVPVVADSTSTAKIAPFIKQFPGRLVNVGIAEQSMVGTAAGLALGGKVAVTCNAAPFLISRANEQIKVDVCYNNTNVKLFGLNAGASYGPLASTHHAIDDLAVMRGFGNIQIFAPSSPRECRQIIDYAIGYQGPVYIRLDGKALPELHDESYRFVPGAIVTLREGDDIALVGYPDAHARLDPSFRNGKEVFDRDLLDMRIVTEEIVVKNHNAVGRRLAQLKLTDHGCFLNRVIRSQIEMPIDDNVVLNKGDVLQVSGDARRVKTVADRIGFISIHSQVTDLLAFCAFFIVGLMIGMITFQFSSFSFGIGNAAGLLFAGIMLGFLRANHPTFGYIPQGALNMVKEFGLMVFMAGVGLSAGAGIGHGLGAIGGQMLAAGLIVSLVPVVICFLFGAYVLRMNRAMLFGAMMGARTCAPAMEIISDTARSNIPALGYAGTYAIANVLLTLAGTLIVIIWPGLQ